MGVSVPPPSLLMLVLAAAYVHDHRRAGDAPALTGLTAAIVGVLLATTYRMGKANISDRLTLGLRLASMVAGAVLGISAAVIVVLAGLVESVCTCCRSGSRRPRRSTMILDLFTRCILTGLLAFGGGGQRCRLSKGSWWRRPAGSVRRISPRRSPSATSRLVRAHYHDAFLGYRMAGLAGAFAATCGIFLMPWALAASAAHPCGWMQHPLLHHFAGVQLPPWLACSSSRPSILAAAPRQRDTCRHCRCGPGAGAVDETAPACAPPRRGSHRRCTG